jgi:hypothetical protein
MHLKIIQIIPGKLYLESRAENCHVNVQNNCRTRTVYCNHNIAATLCTLDTRIYFQVYKSNTLYEGKDKGCPITGHKGKERE